MNPPHGYLLILILTPSPSSSILLLHPPPPTSSSTSPPLSSIYFELHPPPFPSSTLRLSSSSSLSRQGEFRMIREMHPGEHFGRISVKARKPKVILFSLLRIPLLSLSSLSPHPLHSPLPPSFALSASPTHSLTDFQLDCQVSISFVVSHFTFAVYSVGRRRSFPLRICHARQDLVGGQSPSPVLVLVLLPSSLRF